MFVVRKSHVFDKMSGRFPGVFEATTANLFPVGFAATKLDVEECGPKETQSCNINTCNVKVLPSVICRTANFQHLFAGCSRTEPTLYI